MGLPRRLASTKNAPGGTGSGGRVYLLLAALLGVLLWTRSLDVKARALKSGRRLAPVATTLLSAPAQLAVEGMSAGAALDSGWGRDPFERRVAEVGDQERSGSPPGAGPAAAPAALRLEGIMVGPQGRAAVINGEIYREGERVGSCEVIQIGRNRVVLSDHGITRTLELAGGQ